MVTIDHDIISGNLNEVRNQVAAAALDAERPSDDVSLVCVSKTHPPERIVRAIEAGQRLFGENRVQEAEAKWPDLKRQYPDIRLHLIGPLQTNKVRQAVPLFDAIETLDREKLARALAKEKKSSGRCPDLYVQVNTGEESQKSGIKPLEADDFIAYCRKDLLLPVKGLMCIPPIDEEAGLHFALLREIGKRNGLQELSMGMSADFQKAIHFGATLVRVGTAIFGARQPYNP